MMTMAGRTRIGISGHRSLQQAADSSDGLDVVLSEGPIDLSAEIADVPVDDVRHPVILVIPQLLDNQSPREHDSRILHEELQE